MTRSPDHPPSYAVDRVRFADDTSLFLGFPLQRLGARILDWFLAALGAMFLTRLVLSGVDALWGCPGCPFLDPPPAPPAAPTAEIPAGAAEGCPDVAPSCQPDSCGPDEHPSDKTPQRAITETVETAIVLVGFGLYDLFSMMVGDTGSSPGRKVLGIRVVHARNGGRLSRQAIANRAAIQGLGLAVIVALNTLHPAWYVYALAAGSGATLFLNPSRQAWHDLAAATIVVRTRATPPADASSNDELWTPEQGLPRLP